VAKIQMGVDGSRAATMQEARGAPPARWHLLTYAHQPGVRWRERWTAKLGDEGETHGWSEDELKRQVKKDVDAALAEGRFSTERSRRGVFEEGVLGGHPTVRRERLRLEKLRDDLYAHHDCLMRQLFHSPYHALTDIFRKQRDPARRHLVASYKTCLAHLQWRSAQKAASAGPAPPPVVPTPTPPAKVPSTSHTPGTFIFIQFNGSAPRRSARRP
jgi:hypothetical protein